MEGRARRWPVVMFTMTIIMASVKFFYAFAYKDVGKHIAEALMLLLGGIFLVVIPAYIIGKIVDKFKKEKTNIEPDVRLTSPNVVEPYIIQPKSHDVSTAENKISENDIPKSLTTYNFNTTKSNSSSSDNKSSTNIISKSETEKISDTVDNTADNKNDFYAQAWDEINDPNKAPVKALWAKSFALTQGDEKKAQAKYIELRVEQLLHEGKQREIMIKEEIRKQEEEQRKIQKARSFISSLKSTVKENWLNTINGNDLIEICKEAEFIDLTCNHQDKEFSDIVKEMLKEIKKRGIFVKPHRTSSKKIQPDKESVSPLEIISSLKSTVTKNWLNNVSGNELIDKCRQAQLVDSISNYNDTEFKEIISEMLKEIKKRGLS